MFGALELRFATLSLSKSAYLTKFDETLLSHERVVELLDYDASTGIFTWKSDGGRGQVKADQPAGTIVETQPGRSYRYITIDQIRVRSARLAIFYVTGSWPTGDVNRADKNGLNDSYNNLRVATRSQNIGNSKLSSANSTGYKGVHYYKRTGQYTAAIKMNGKKRHLGYFIYPQDAHNAYMAAAEQVFEQFARAS